MAVNGGDGATDAERAHPVVALGSMPRALLGVNLPYFYGSYGHDLAPSARFPDWPCDFDLTKAYRPLLEAQELGLSAVRIWLCEGAEGLLVDGERITGVHPKLLESITFLQEAAALIGVRIYWTLLDANSAARDGDAITRAVLLGGEATRRFAEHVAVPIARHLDPKIAVGLEIVNEPEVVTESCKDVQPVPHPTVAWSTVGGAIATCRAAVLAERPQMLVTAGTGYAFLPDLWRSGAGLDAVDIHIYHESGGLPSRADIAGYVGDAALASDAVPIIAGECGVTKPHHDEHALRNYLINADGSGYAAAFLWKLEGDLVQSKDPRRALTGTGADVRDELKARPTQGFVLGAG